MGPGIDVQPPGFQDMTHVVAKEGHTPSAKALFSAQVSALIVDKELLKYGTGQPQIA
jgi:hypothetical protein